MGLGLVRQARPFAVYRIQITDRLNGHVPSSQSQRIGKGEYMSAKDDVKDKVDKSAEKTKDAVDKVADKTKDTAHETGEKLKGAGHKVKHSTD
jgi:hypothetical protein